MSESSQGGDIGAGLFFGTICGVVAMAAVVVFVMPNRAEEAIERGYALYCPTTGDFAWKGECEE